MIYFSKKKRDFAKKVKGFFDDWEYNGVDSIKKYDTVINKDPYIYSTDDFLPSFDYWERKILIKEIYEVMDKKNFEKRKEVKEKRKEKFKI